MSEHTKFLEEKCEEIEERLLVNPAEAHKRIKELSGKQRNSRRTHMIKDENGLLLLESSEVKDRWQQYTKNLYDYPNRSESMPFVFEEPLPGPAILKDEVWWAMKIAKENKAMGPDGIPIEALKALEDMGVDLVHHLISRIYETGVVPDESVFVTLPKNLSATECVIFRTISLMSHVLMLLLRIMVQKIEKKPNF